MLRALVCAALVLAAAPFALAQSSAPIVLSHAGRLLDGNDAPVNGTKTLRFALTKNAQKPVDGETSEWSEQYTVDVHNGFYTLELGSTANNQKAIPASAFGDGSARFLAVTIDGVELSPRLRVGLVPFAIDAQQLAGRPASDYALATDVTTLGTALRGETTQATAALETKLTAADTALEAKLTAADTALGGRIDAVGTRTTALETKAATLAATADVAATYQTKQAATDTFATKDGLTQALAAYDTRSVTAGKYLGLAGRSLAGDLDVGTNTLKGSGFLLEAEAIRPSNSVGAEGATSGSSGGKRVVALSTGAAGRVLYFSGERTGGTYDVVLRAAISNLTPADVTTPLGELRITNTPAGGSPALTTMPILVRDFQAAGTWTLLGLRGLTLGGAGSTVAVEVTFNNGRSVDLELDYVLFQLSAQPTKRSILQNGRKFSMDAVFCGAGAPTNGAFSESGLTGYRAGKLKCESVCRSSTAHMCDTQEITRSAALGVIPSGTTGWVNTGIWSYNRQPIYYRDCIGWTNGGNGYDQASYWHPSQFPDNSWCDTVRPVMCCD